MWIDPGKDFEDFMRFEVPCILNLSPSKQVALRIKFSNFADMVRPLAKKGPKEFEYFVNEFENLIRSVERWRAPKGKIVRSSIYRIDSKLISESCPNGKPKYRLWDKLPPRADA